MASDTASWCPLLKTRVPGEHNAEIRNELQKAGIKNAQISGSGESGFTILAKKSQEAGTDEWTHFKYSPEGTAVSKDEKVAPPTHAKWISGDETIPRIGFSTRPGIRIHNGKVLYANWWKPNQTSKKDGTNELTLRDAYNGTLLWKKRTMYGKMIGTPSFIQIRLFTPCSKMTSQLAWMTQR